MPIWEYQCPVCGTTKELIVLTRTSPITQCATCHVDMERVPSVSGFVVTGYNAKNLYSKKS